jgi:methyltransferase (TIGR00027 family)
MGLIYLWPGWIRLGKLNSQGHFMRKDKPSKTARKVALNIVTLGAKPGMDKVLPAGIVETTAELLVASGAVGPTAVRWSRSPRMVSVYKAFDWMMPGQFEAFGHRKAFCERQVRQGITGGARQVLVLGAGYDTVGWRLSPEFADVNFFEIDHPATAALKAKGIETMGQRDNLHLIGEDLGKRRLVDVLESDDSWDSEKQAVIVAEGLLMYLPAEAVRDLFNQCASIAAPGSRIAFTYIATGADGRPDVGRWTGLVLWILKVTGEPWLWSVQPEKLGPFLKDGGWTNAPQLLGTTDKHGVEFLGVATRPAPNANRRDRRTK